VDVNVHIGKLARPAKPIGLALTWPGKASDYFRISVAMATGFELALNPEFWAQAV
jgi:hypothetical protein